MAPWRHWWKIFWIYPPVIIMWGHQWSYVGHQLITLGHQLLTGVLHNPHNNWWSPVIIWWSLVINWRPPHNNWWPRVINQWPPYNNWWPPVIMWWPRDNNWRINSENFSPMSPGSFRNDVIWTFSLFAIFMMGFNQCWYGRSTMLIISGGRIWNTHLATMLHTYEYLKNKTYC